MPLSGPEVLAPTPRDPAQKFWDPAAQTLAPERRRALQDQRVRELVRRCLETPAPFFARKLESAGITSPDDVKGAADLAQIPLTLKQELRDSEAAHPPIGDYRFTQLRDCVRVGQSTGTTGTPRPSANARAAAIPTRSPVNGPGPIPAATCVMSEGETDASASARSISVPMTSAWPRGSRLSTCERMTPSIRTFS